MSNACMCTASSAARFSFARARPGIVMPAPTVFVREVESVFGADGALRDPATRASVADMLAAFAFWIDRATARVRTRQV